MTEPLTAAEKHPDYARALLIAKGQGIIGQLHRVEDRWGGYWQCATPHGVYNFRTDLEQGGRL